MRTRVRTFSVLDIAFLRNTALEAEKAIKVESLKSGMTERGVKRAIRQAVKRGHVELSRFVQA